VGEAREVAVVVVADGHEDGRIEREQRLGCAFFERAIVALFCHVARHHDHVGRELVHCAHDLL